MGYDVLMSGMQKIQKWLENRLCVSKKDKQLFLSIYRGLRVGQR